MLEHDERVRRAVVDRGDAHHRRTFDRGHAARLGKEALPCCLVRPIAEDLESDDLLGGVVERVPHISEVIATFEHREAEAAGEDLADLSAADGGRGRRFGAVHPHGLTPAGCFVIGDSPNGPLWGPDWFRSVTALVHDDRLEVRRRHLGVQRVDRALEPVVAEPDDVLIDATRGES